MKNLKEIKNAKGLKNPIKTKGMFNKRTLKTDLHAFYGELIGTIFFLLFSLGGIQATATNLSANNTGSDGTSVQGSDAARLMGLFYISSAFGMSLFAVASIFYRFTGSIFNPNVSLALMLCGVITPVRFAFVCIAQFLGSIIASALLLALLPGPLAVGVSLGFNTSKGQGVFIEAFCTCALVFVVLMTAAEKNAFTPFAPLAFGFMLFVLELFAVEYTGGAINTARAFGPSVISGFPSYHWIYWVGPSIGSLIASALYYLLKYVKYWEISPGQDSTDPEDSALSNIGGSRQGKPDNQSQQALARNDSQV